MCNGYIQKTNSKEFGQWIEHEFWTNIHIETYHFGSQICKKDKPTFKKCNDNQSFTQHEFKRLSKPKKITVCFYIVIWKYVARHWRFSLRRPGRVRDVLCVILWSPWSSRIHSLLTKTHQQCMFNSLNQSAALSESNSSIVPSTQETQNSKGFNHSQSVCF